jgi:hypothetical protein
MKDKRYIVVILLLFLAFSQFSGATTPSEVHMGGKEERI